MAAVPVEINGVTIKFGARVDPEIDQSLLDALRQIVTADLSSGEALISLYVSSISETTATHSSTSRHYPPGRKAIDISRVNDKRMSVFFATDALVAEVTKNLQERFELLTPIRRENFGPFLQRKLGQVDTRPGIIRSHRSHIHFSVN